MIKIVISNLSSKPQTKCEEAGWPMNSLKHAIPTSSVNDEYFHLPRVRNAPIKSSMCCIDGLPKKLKIYRIAGSKYWQMRLYNLGKYTTQSLKTTDKEEAVAQARLIFESLK